jgi:hypothetical protein
VLFLFVLIVVEGARLLKNANVFLVRGYFHEAIQCYAGKTRPRETLKAYSPEVGSQAAHGQRVPVTEINIQI